MISLIFYEGITNRPTDGQTNGPTEREVFQAEPIDPIESTAIVRYLDRGNFFIFLV